MAIYNGGLSIIDLRQTENSWSGQQTITSPSRQYGKVEIGVDSESGYIELYNQDMGKANNSAHLDMHNNLYVMPDDASAAQSFGVYAYSQSWSSEASLGTLQLRAMEKPTSDLTYTLQILNNN